MSTVSSASSSSSTQASHVSSIASGLDTDALVEAAVAQKLAPADTIDARIDANEARIAAYQELQTLVAAIADSLETLAAPTSSALSSTNSFDAKQAFLSATDSFDPDEAIAVSVGSEASAASYDIEVVQLATAMKVAGDTLSGSDALGLAGAFSIGTDGGTSVEIDVTADMTLADIAEAITSAGADAGVAATLVQVSSGSYRLTLSGLATGETLLASAVSGDDVLAGIGLTASDGSFATVIRAAQNAVIVVDGLQIERDSNELTDVIPGVSISLLGVSEGATITFSIEMDYEGVKTAITSFVDAYNALRTFVATQQAVGSDGVVPEDAVLFADSLLRSMTSLVRDLLSRPVGEGSVSTLADLGVTFTSDNGLSLSDETALDDLILTDASSLRSFFETSFAPSDTALRLLANTSTLDFDFTLEVSADADGTITGVTADGRQGLFTVEGARIIGASGTAYEGLVFSLVTNGEKTINVSIRQGFANLLSAFFNAYGDATGGLIQKQVDALSTADTALQTRSDRIRESAETYRTSLVDRYAAMEVKVQAAQLLQQQIEAILGAQSDE